MKTVGILGGGQLGKMLAEAGTTLGIHCRLYDPAADACGRNAGEFMRGAYDDLSALKTFATGLDCVTYEFENIPLSTVELIAPLTPCRPPAAALRTAQDRLFEKELFRRLGIATNAFRSVATLAELEAALDDELAPPVVLKTRRLGYDGKGQFVLRQRGDAARAWNELNSSAVLVETFVPFEREVSLLAVAGKDGGIGFYPLVENTHRAGILRLSRAPAPSTSPALQQTAEHYVTALCKELSYCGVLAVEFFVKGGELIANEIAPRVHNSGHWTIEGAETSQFENHLRAVTGMPLGSCAARGSSAMINLIGSLPALDKLRDRPDIAVHLYGKAPREGRKIGHVTVTAENDTELQRKLLELATLLPL